MNTIRVEHDPAAVALAAAELIAESAAAATAERGVFHVALAGGTTPRAAYEALRALPVEWGAVHVWFGDERAVPPADPDSNYRMAKDALLDHVTIPPSQVHRMPADAVDLDAAAARYASELPAVLDLVVLGMGEDGHTASIFPGSSATAERNRSVVPVIAAPKPPPRRLTITPPVLDAARECVVLVTGAGKAGVLARVLEGAHAPSELPVQLAEDAHYIVDRAAAAALGADWIHRHAAAGERHG